MHRNLRTRLLTLVFLGIACIALVNLLTSGLSLQRVRNRAITNSGQALQQENEQYLRQFVKTQATVTTQVLESAQQIAQILVDALSNPPTDRTLPPPTGVFTTTDGRRYIQAATTILIPPTAGAAAFDEIQTSATLETLLPAVAQISPAILRVSYISANGMLRTVPAVVPVNVAADWMLESDLAFQVGTPTANPQKTLVWTDVHRVFAGTEYVISAVQPVYRAEQFAGVVVVDLSIEDLTSFLEQLKFGALGFPALMTDDGVLIAATEIGQRVLLGRLIVSREDRGQVRLDQADPGIEPLLVSIRQGEHIVATVTIKQRDYMMVSTRIEGVGWNLVIAIPVDEITATTLRTTEEISRISTQTQLLGLMIALAMTLIIGFALRQLLRRQLLNPLTTLMQATRAIASGDLQPITMPFNDEIGQLASSFNTMTSALNESRAAILSQNQDLERIVQERTADLQQSIQRTEYALATQQDLLQTLNKVSSPIIPVIEGVLALPLIGQLTAERTHFATQQLLERIARERVHTVLLDLTGVPVIDAPAAEALQKTVLASSLLGAHTVMVGIRPEVAQTMVAMGLDLHDIATAADLRSAIRQIIQRGGR